MIHIIKDKPSENQLSSSVIMEKFLKFNSSIRLGSLAANLARIYSFTIKLNYKEGVETMLDESKFFIEWMAKDSDANTRVFLLQLQRQLVVWSFRLTEL
jgi:hypothetical protein